MSLRLKLALTAALLTLGGVGVGLAITYGVLVTGANVSFDRESAILAEVIHEAVLLRGDTAIRVPAVVESYLTTESGVRSAQVFLDGQLLWEGGVLDGPRPLDPSGLVEGRGTRTVSGWRVVTLFDAGDGITVQVGRPLASMREALAPFGWLVLPLTLVLALVAGALAWLSAGLALRPLRVLTTAVTALDDVSEVPAITGSDEPAQLARAFRDLVERLRSQRQREHDFLAYAAHELRTPLSALRASLDAARSQDGTLTPGTLERLRREASRLEAMAQNLLALSRAEAADVHRDTIDLADLAADAYDRFQPLALEKGLELRLEGSAAVARADERLLAQALDNLVHNAIRATSKGSVSISTGVAEGRPYLTVADTGPGFPIRPRAGLGLRVVRAVVAAHGGEFEISGKHGAEVRLSLPVGGA
ncbi:MAG TPA: HAMP domain-containing sensor histidine kinase [Trueperaceae bacterium]|nr:HAMP domain-containing sensor histidine kinase [Trueperaceae bacterium]